MGEYFVHPKHSVILRGVERRGGEKVTATLGEVAALPGKLLTAEEFEEVCIDLQAAAEHADENAGKELAASLEAMRKGEAPPFPTIDENKE